MNTLKLSDEHLAVINEGLQHVPMGRAFPVVQAINAQLAWAAQMAHDEAADQRTPSGAPIPKES
jgi:hypothetical protein